MSGEGASDADVAVQLVVSVSVSVRPGLLSAQRKHKKHETLSNASVGVGTPVAGAWGLLFLLHLLVLVNLLARVPLTR